MTIPDPGGWREREALWRWSLIQHAADPALTPRQRGALVRAIAQGVHPHPSGAERRVARSTLDEWIRAHRRGGFAALKPAERLVHPRTPPGVLEEAAAMRREAPERTATMICDALRRLHGEAAPTARTLQRHFARTGLTRERLVGHERAAGRFEAARANEMWTADVLHGPRVGGRVAYLHLAIDDHSRFVVAARFFAAEDHHALGELLRGAFMGRGVPERLYTDRGAPFVSAHTRRALAILGVRLIHSRPGQPRGRGKVERMFRTIREGFLGEAARRGPGSLEELDGLLGAWLSQVYHRRTHSETREPPAERFARVVPRYPGPELLREAFLVRVQRTVSRTATVSVLGNTYEVDQALVGRRVELAFDPHDLTQLEVHHLGRRIGLAVPHQITRHVHPELRAHLPERAPATGIDYLGLVSEAHQAEARRHIAYRDIPGAGEQARP